MRNVCIILCSLCFSQSEQIFTFYMYRSKKSCVLLNAEKIFFSLRRKNRFRCKNTRHKTSGFRDQITDIRFQVREVIGALDKEQSPTLNQCEGKIVSDKERDPQAY